MGWKSFNDRLALALLGLLGAMLFYLAVREPGLRDKILTLLGAWGTLLVQFYFRKAPPADQGGK